VAVPQNLPPDGRPAILKSAASSSGFVGLYQINATVPDGVSPGVASVVITAAEKSRQPEL
jgi:uncharacterized protein (TIGR03437 family)